MKIGETKVMFFFGQGLEHKKERLQFCYRKAQEKDSTSLML